MIVCTCFALLAAGVIAKEIKAEYFDLEDPVDLTRLDKGRISEFISC